MDLVHEYTSHNCNSSERNELLEQNKSIQPYSQLILHGLGSGCLTITPLLDFEKQKEKQKGKVGIYGNVCKILWLVFIFSRHVSISSHLYLFILSSDTNEMQPKWYPPSWRTLRQLKHSNVLLLFQPVNAFLTTMTMNPDSIQRRRGKKSN